MHIENEKKRREEKRREERGAMDISQAGERGKAQSDPRGRAEETRQEGRGRQVGNREYTEWGGRAWYGMLSTPMSESSSTSA